jgi:multidrug efflux pump subunit AcrA (membrane-fusion protein)
MRRLVEVERGRTVTLSEVSRMGEILGLSAVVRLRGGDFAAEWKGRFDRLSDTIDPQTRTVGAIVTVEGAVQKVEAGVRPLLTKNMFVEVEVRGKSLPGRLVIPRSALHVDRVYVVNADSRLEIRKVEIAFFQTNFAVLKSGLRVSERVVVSDLIPAIAGMKLKPVPDEGLARSLAAEAEGKVPVK